MYIVVHSIILKQLIAGFERQKDVSRFKTDPNHPADHWMTIGYVQAPSKHEETIETEKWITMAIENPFASTNIATHL